MKIENCKFNNYGFTLIEVTIAVAIIAMAIVATGALLARIPVDGRATRDQDLALRIVRSEIETLQGAGYDALPASGPFADAQLSALPSGAAALTVAVYSAKTKRIDATVTWLAEGGATRQVALTTLMTQNSGLK